MSNNVVQELPVTAFGEFRTEFVTAILQISPEYGLLGQVLTVADSASSGTNSVADNMFTCETGAASDGLASITSLRQIKQRAGQGIISRFSTLYDTALASSFQIGGFITAENSLVFGFLGTTFGIAHTFNGETESQELTITAFATGAENATVTIDGVGFTVPLTLGTGTVQHTAFEVAESLQAQVANYTFTSNDDQVVVQALLAGPTTTFIFSSATAAGTFAQVTAGVTATVSFIPQASWNEDTLLTGDFILNHQTGNIYQIQFQALGFGVMRFFIEEPDTGDIILVHTIQFPNSGIITNVSNPTFRVGWSTQNTGNTSNIKLQGGGAGGFLEGQIHRNNPPRSASNNQLAVGTALTNILTIRNRTTFGGRVNRIEILPLLLAISSQANKSTFFKFLINPTFAGDLDFSYIDKTSSVIEVAIDSVGVSGGLEIGSVTIAPDTGELIRFNETTTIDTQLLSNSTLCIASQVASGAAADMQVGLSWEEDF